MEAQSDIVDVVNDIVSTAIKKREVPDDKLILLPTGDGICIALLNMESPYDIHMQIALDILGKLSKYNAETEDKMRKFQVRIGVNANIDNIVTDINEKRNIAGAGINMAQRIMNMAEGGQILVGQTVFEILRQREKYMYSFRPYIATLKHNVRLPVYQYIGEGYAGLNVGEPTSFVVPPKIEPKLTKLVAYYFAHAITKEEFFLSNVRRPQSRYATVDLLWFLANDSVKQSGATKIRPHDLKRMPGGEKASFEERFEYFMSLNFWVCCNLASFIEEIDLSKYHKCFKEGDYRFISSEGMEKLRKEWPNIWNEFGLDRFT